MQQVLIKELNVRNQTRYDNLFDTLDGIYERKLHHGEPPALRLMEVGTYDGARAAQLLHYWLQISKKAEAPVDYYGFDMWESMTESLSRKELSKKKLPPSEATVRKKLAAVDDRVHVHLVKGNTHQTLMPACGMLAPMDLVFLDGGHSLNTIANDWVAVTHVMSANTFVVFDDYYLNRVDFGCQSLIETLRKQGDYEIKLLDPIDHFPETGLSIRMAAVRRRA